MDGGRGITPYETREILFYKTDNGDVRVEILLYQENLWLTQAKMAELFEVQKAAISKHLKNIFESGELTEETAVSKMETTAADGKQYNTNYYNLDAFLQFNEEDVLYNKGKVTAAIAKTFAEGEFEKFRVLQDKTYQSDFDRLIASIEEDRKINPDTVQ